MKKILDYFQNFAKSRVLCIGDIMLDHFVYGDVMRISPEAPIPVLRVRREKNMLGGVGNVVANLSSLGVNVSLLSVVGNDVSADSIGTKLREINIDTKLLVDETRPTSIKTRFISGGQQLLRTDIEDTKFLNKNTQDLLLKEIGKKATSADVIVISDYGKGVLSPELFSFIMDKGVRVVVDPKGRDYSIYKNAYLVTPNKQELAEATGMPTETDEEVVVAAKYLIENFGIKNILVTRSKDGVSIVYGDGSVHHICTDVLEVYDVSGAGDTVVASIASMLAAGASLEISAEMANIAGGIVVGKVGTAVVSIDDIEQKIIDADDKHDSATVLSSAKEQIEKWREKGLKVGFSNGCFDLLHPGHISLLKQAKAKCDRLIIGLNTDASVKLLKGNDRPVQDEQSRSMVLKALKTVDMVVLFDEDTPMELLQELKPDVLIKGGDYKIDEVVGAEYVMSYGGEIHLAIVEEGQSTTSMIKRATA